MESMEQGAENVEQGAKRERSDYNEMERPCEIASHHFVNFTGQARKF